MRDLSIVVPTLNEARTIGAALDHVAGGDAEVIVVDAGSADGTAETASAHTSAPIVLRDVKGGRARQLNAGAATASGDILVFLHADSRLPPDGLASVRSAAARGIVGGNFRLRFDGGDFYSAYLTRFYAFQRRLGFYYGDSTIWCTRATFETLGGFRELPIMDDYDFARRLEALGPTACLPGPALTSARRWRALGVPRTVLSWIVIRYLFVLGVAPERLAKLYAAIR